MAKSDNSRVVYAIQADLQNHAQQMAAALNAVTVGEEASFLPNNASNAERIVGELVRQYLHCSTQFLM